MAELLTPDLLARYADTRLPRYTSYPTSPNFSTDVGETHYRSWLSSLPATPASMYLHIPFCRAMCWYCGCHTTVAAREAPVTRYLDCLMQEIALVARVAARPLMLSHIHFGGGTPTLIPASQLRLIMARLRELFSVARGAEIAIEIDPRTFTAEMADALGECGFNRASLGVQSFDGTVQRAINRVQSFDETATAAKLLRSNGIRGLNLDLIYGLPIQTVESCIDTVARAVTLNPDRFAVFGYAHVPSFKPHQRKIDVAALPDSDARFAQSQVIAEALVRAGYREIGLDHFARPGDPLAIAAADGSLHRNFQGYTTDDAEVLIGLGASSIGRMSQGYVQNEVRIPEYQRLVGEARLPIARGYRYKGTDRLRGEIIERLMCVQNVDVARLCRKFDTDVSTILADAPLQSLVADGLIDLKGGKVIIKPHARSLVRSVAAAFDAYLHDGGDRYSRAV